MSQSGGSATINGVLYQILGALDHAVQIGIRCKCDDAEWTESELKIEPAGGGGDSQIKSSRTRIVEQWKSKSDGGSWSVREIVEEVLPDLYLAVEEDHFGQPVEYRFVTEGHEGRFKATNELLSKLASSEMPKEPITALDDITPRSFFAKEQHTERGFFIRILKSVRKRVRKEPCKTSIRKLWHLLARFKFAEPVPFDKLRADVNSMLVELVETREEVEAKRQQICTALMEMARHGEVVLNPSDFLVQVGLRARPFRDGRAWGILKQIIADDFDTKLGFVGYEAAADVRKPLAVPTTEQPILIGGESGVGKSWSLARMGMEVSNTGCLPVYVEASGDPEKTLQRVSDVIWKVGLDHDQPLDLASVAKRMKEGLPGRQEPFAVVLIDNVQSTVEARELLRQVWANWNIALVISMPDPLAASVAQSNAVATYFHLTDYSQIELKNYLRFRNRDWGTVPSDIRDTLRRPLLARLYCDLGEKPGWHPTNEYQLYSAFWKQLDDVEHPSDLTIAKSIAKALLDDAVAYPWTGIFLEQSGLKDPARSRLEKRGWLRRVEENKEQVWHVRLLNWAIAEAVVDDLVNASSDVPDLINSVASHWASHRTMVLPRRFGYVPMDVLWILTDRYPIGRISNVVTQLLQGLDKEPMSSYTEYLYTEMLPTLGPKILEPVLNRTEASGPSGSKPSLSYVAKCFIRLSLSAPEEVALLTTRMLESKIPEIGELAVRIPRKAPLAGALEKLWKWHMHNVLRLADDKDRYRFGDYEDTFSALSSCVALNPDWLPRKLGELPDDGRGAAELAFLVATLPDNPGADLWNNLKQEFFQMIPVEARRSLTNCIARFGDVTEAERLVVWLSEPGWIPGHAFVALCTVAPKVALLHMRPVALKDVVWWMHSAWLAELLWREPERTWEAIRKWMQKSPEEIWQIARLLREVAYKIDGPTLEALLTGLDYELEKDLSGEDADTRPLEKILETLANIWLPEALAVFREYRGSTSEVQLASLLCHSLKRTPNQISETILDHGINVLLKFRGSGLTKVINTLLGMQNSGAWSVGIQWAVACWDNETKRLLRTIAASDHTTEGRGGEVPFIQSQALVALAALSDDETVVRAVLKWGNLIVTRDLTEECAVRPPVADDVLDVALNALDKTESAANALEVIGLSRRKDLIPLVRKHVTEDGEVRTVQTALHALLRLRFADPDMLPHLENLLQNDNFRSHALRLIMRIDTEQAGDIVERELINSGETEVPRSRWRGVHFLLSKPTRKRRILEYLWPKIRISENPMEILETGNEESFAVFAELNTREVEEFLWNQAFAKYSGINFGGQTEIAIRGLAKIDPDEAFRAAEQLLESTEKDRELFPQLLMDIDTEKAVPLLCRNSVTETKVFALWATGVAFRMSPDMELVRKHLREMLVTNDATVQKAGAFLCGWMDSGFLTEELHRLAVASSQPVRKAARESMERQEKAQVASTLTQQLANSSGATAWCLLEGVVQLVNPLLLSDPVDAYGLRKVAKHLPPVGLQFINAGIRQRREKIKREARDLDRANERDG